MEHHIIEYSPKREKQIRADYENEHAKARKIPICYAQSRGDELIETEFTANELLTLDKTIRETFGAEYDIVNVEYKALNESGNGKGYITYSIVHKELFKRANAKWDKNFKTFCYGKTPIVIPVCPEVNYGTGYYSCEGYIWLTFRKVSNRHIILFTSSDIETCTHKEKYAKHWEKIGHLYMTDEVLFDKYLDSIKSGINNIKTFFFLV